MSTYTASIPTTTTTTFYGTAACALLVAEGFDRADVEAVYDSLVNAGYELDQVEDDEHVLTVGEVDVMREQLLTDAVTVEVTANVIDGVLEFDRSGLGGDGPETDAVVHILTDPVVRGLITRIPVGPWDIDEEDMERADAALRDVRMVRVSEWDGDNGDQYRSASVTRAPGEPATRLIFQVLVSCSGRPEVRRYDVHVVSLDAAVADAADRYSHESTIGVDVADVTVRVIGIDDAWNSQWNG